MNYNFASIEGLGPGSLPYLRKIDKTRRAETFSGNEQTSSRIRVSEQNFEQNKPFYEQNLTKPNKPYTLLRRAGSVLRRFTPKITIARQYAERFGNPRRRSSGKPTQNAAWQAKQQSLKAQKTV